MRYSVLNAYRIMWLFVFFDLPVVEKQDQKRAQRFRTNLIKDGFTMLQYSVYIRHCASHENMEVHRAHVTALVPPKGKVSVLAITDKQFADTTTYYGGNEKPPPPTPAQLEMF